MAETFFRIEDGSYVPTPASDGPWQGRVAGRLLGGLAAHLAETAAVGTTRVPIRFHVDLLRLADRSPISADVDVEARSARLTDVRVVLHQSDRRIAVATALLTCAGGTREVTEVGWTGSGTDVPAWPDEPAPLAYGARLLQWNDTGAVTSDYTAWRHPGRRAARIEDVLALLPGTPLTAFVRAVMAADLVSPMANWTADGLQMINTDYTVSLATVPRSETLTLVALERIPYPEVAISSATLFDAFGPIGLVTASALRVHRTADLSRGG